MAFDVFISHSSKDHQVASATCAALENAGIRCWIAPRNILPGEDWDTAILRGISSVRAMVLIFSGHANQSKDVAKEVFVAMNRDVVVVPFRIEDVRYEGKLEYHLATTHWIDAITPTLQEHLEELTSRMTTLVEPREAVVDAEVASDPVSSSSEEEWGIADSDAWLEQAERENEERLWDRMMLEAEADNAECDAQSADEPEYTIVSPPVTAAPTRTHTAAIRLSGTRVQGVVAYSTAGAVRIMLTKSLEGTRHHDAVIPAAYFNGPLPEPGERVAAYIVREPDSRTLVAFPAAVYRVHELSKHLGMTSKELLDHLSRMRIPAKNHASTLVEAYVGRILSELAHLMPEVDTGAPPSAATESAKAVEESAVAPREEEPEPARVPRWILDELREGLDAELE